MLSILLLDIAFPLIYSKISPSLAYCWIRSSSHIPGSFCLTCVRMCSVLKLKIIIKNSHTINCFVYRKILVYSLATCHLQFKIDQPLIMFVVYSWKFLEYSLANYIITPIMLAICFMLSSPYYACLKLCWHNRCMPIATITNIFASTTQCNNPTGTTGKCSNTSEVW